MKRRGAVVVLAALAAIGLSLTPAFATGRHHRGHGEVLVVDNEHHHRSCLGTRKPFDTIQGAVDAARPGATIWVCPGVYDETVKVQKPHPTLKGANAGRDATRSGATGRRWCASPSPGRSRRRCSCWPTTSPGTGSRSSAMPAPGTALAC